MRRAAFGDEQRSNAARGIAASADLAAIGLPAARAATIRGLAAAVLAGELRLDASDGLDEAVERLTRLPGVGAWSAHYIALLNGRKLSAAD